MIHSGLVSVTFRKKSVEEICALCARVGLTAIEWGGDVHVPPEDEASAAHARRLSAAYGLTVCSYGSYYRLGQPTANFEQNLRAAVRLGAPVMRIWSGLAGSAETDAGQRAQWVAQLIEHARAARAVGVRLALEYHGNTLTDTRESVRALMQETAAVSDALDFYWQPRFDWSEPERLASFDDVRPRLGHLHVFTWAFECNTNVRKPLADGEGMWREVFSRLKDERYALLEFVQDDCDEALARDAAVLNDWLKHV